MQSDIAAMLSAAIETPRLMLEPMGERHAEAFFPALQEEPLYQWISMGKPTSLEQLSKHWRTIESRMSPDNQTAWPTWAVRRKTDGVYLGRVDAEINDALEATNVGYYFFSSHWGQGYATESVAAVTEHLIVRGVRRLVATVTVGNTASVRVLQNAGYTFTRVLVANDLIRGINVDDEEYVKSSI